MRILKIINKICSNNIIYDIIEECRKSVSVKALTLFAMSTLKKLQMRGEMGG